MSVVPSDDNGFDDGGLWGGLPPLLKVVSFGFGSDREQDAPNFAGNLSKPRNRPMGNNILD